MQNIFWNYLRSRVRKAIGKKGSQRGGGRLLSKFEGGKTTPRGENLSMLQLKRGDLSNSLGSPAFRPGYMKESWSGLGTALNLIRQKGNGRGPRSMRTGRTGR